MKLLCCVVTYNRKQYTERCFSSLFNTTNEGAEEDTRFVIVDNGSTDGTEDFLSEVESWRSALVVRNARNVFPGAATNIGWQKGLENFDADLLMRLDNDMELVGGWREHVEEVFTNVWELGLFGLHNRHEDYDGNPPVNEQRGINVEWDNVGGNCVMRRQLWDQGLRWVPGSWAPGGQDEDTWMSHKVSKRGLLVGCAIPVLCNNMSFHRYEDYPAYYNETAALRGLVPELSV